LARACTVPRTWHEHGAPCAFSHSHACPCDAQTLAYLACALFRFPPFCAVGPPPLLHSTRSRHVAVAESVLLLGGRHHAQKFVPWHEAVERAHVAPPLSSRLRAMAIVARSCGHSAQTQRSRHARRGCISHNLPRTTPDTVVREQPPHCPSPRAARRHLSSRASTDSHPTLRHPLPSSRTAATTMT